MKKLILLCFLIPMICFGQKLDMDKLKGLAPRSIGPAGMAGRVTTIDVVNHQPNTIYVGTASGGIWKSENGGTSWESLFDKQSTASIGAIAIQQSNPSVIWAGTGEGNPRNSLNGGDGIYKSLDAGKSWIKMGLEKTRNIHRIVIDPSNPNNVYVAAIGSPWGVHKERGVYKTKDGGKTWKQILYNNEKTGCAELVMDPTNPNKLYAGMWEHYRQPWFFTSGGEGSGLYVSHDGGDTWTKRTEEDGLPEGNLGRIGLAVAPSNPSIVYALIESKKNALYKSEDGGFKWKKINDKDEIGNRPFYYSDIRVDPKNEFRLYTIYTYVNVSNDGGQSFSRLMPAYNSNRGVHPDHHAWWIHPEDPYYIIEGNDGGLNISRDRGNTWRFVENIPVAQFYHIAVDNDVPYNVYGGMQDNGSWAGPAYVWKDQGIRNSYWQEISFGDGFDVVPDPDNNRYGYSLSQEGWVGRYDRQTGYFEYVKPQEPLLDEKLRFNWNSAIAQDPFNNNTIYFGSQFLHKSKNKGLSWEIISPDLTTNDKEKQKQYESGGLTMDATGAENYCTILAIAPSSLNKNLVWASTDDGNIQITRDGGKSWNNVSKNIKDAPEGGWIPQIKASKYAEGEAIVIINNYRKFDFAPYAFRTKNHGKTWERIVDKSDVIGYTLSIVQDPVEPSLFFLGTDDGLYVSIDDTKTWTKWTNEYPTVNTMDLVIHPIEQDLVIGTFGRAAYVLDDIRPLRELSRKGLAVLDQTLNVFPVPTAYQSAEQQPTGTRFSADAMFSGENRKSGAMITYSLNIPKKENIDSTSNIKFDSLYIQISNSSGEVIRNLKFEKPKESGLHRTYWRLDEKGVASLSRRPLKRENEPSGITALPGIYSLKITFGDHTDSTMVEVKADPRLNISLETMQAKYNALKDLEGLKSLALNKVEKIKSGLAGVEIMIERMKLKDEKAFEEIIKESKSIKDSLTNLLSLYVGKEDKRQGITDDPVLDVNDLYSSTYMFISNATHKPGSMEEKLVQKTTDMIVLANEKTDSYFDTYWDNYKTKVENLSLSPFDSE